MKRLAAALILALILFLPAWAVSPQEATAWVESVGGTYERNPAGEVVSVDLNSAWLTDADLEEAILRNANSQDTVIDPNLAATLDREQGIDKVTL